MLIKCYGAAPQGIDAVIVTIEVHAVPGFEFTLVGLPDSAVKESHERIVAALTVNGYNRPRHTLTINMAPADIKKEGAAYDLPLAIGMLTAEEEVKTALLGQYLIMVSCHLMALFNRFKAYFLWLWRHARQDSKESFYPSKTPARRL